MQIELLRSSFEDFSSSFESCRRRGLGKEGTAVVVVHGQLRRALQLDPAMDALMTGGGNDLFAGALPTLGRGEDGPWRLDVERGLLMLPPVLLFDSAALSVCTRWGLEAAAKRTSLVRVLVHGRSLLRTLSKTSLDLVLSMVPGEELRKELVVKQSTTGTTSDALLVWQRGRASQWPAEALEPPQVPSQLWESLETILVSGGDTRLTLLEDGFNRYGTLPRPRPEAVHFSSSTASCVSEYGFFYCEQLRRAMLATPASMHRRREILSAATANYLRRLAGLTSDSADVVLAPSGTDTEILAVQIALAKQERVTNILISPEETGRGVKYAAAGQFYDIVSPTGTAVTVGQPIWDKVDIHVVSIPIRDDNGAPRVPAAIEDDIRNAIDTAVAAGRHVLLHYLACSKTGLQAPLESFVSACHEQHRDHLDVVVDACQMRSPFHEMARWVLRGWLCQVSGSKFLTGPAFSGAMLVPVHFRERSERTRALTKHTFCYESDWSTFGTSTAVVAAATTRDHDHPPPSFGPLFRWLPALLEAELFNQVPAAQRIDSFQRFRHALLSRLRDSEELHSVEDPVSSTVLKPDSQHDFNLANGSIVCFYILVEGRPLNEEACRRLFFWLNKNLLATSLFSSVAEKLNHKEAALAQMECHIGQPVQFHINGEPAAVMRMVLGARFFSIVSHSGAYESALECEISDALRALEKIEFLAKRWKFLN